MTTFVAVLYIDGNSFSGSLPLDVDKKISTLRESNNTYYDSSLSTHFFSTCKIPYSNAQKFCMPTRITLRGQFPKVFETSDH